MNNKRFRVMCSAFLFLILLLGSAVPALADGLIVPVPPPDVPIVDVPYLTVKYHRVTVTIDNQVATTRVDQVFVNEGRHEVEGTYIFPLPEEAAIGEFTMWVDGQKLAGQVLQREEARRIYEEIVRKRRDPALLEYVGRNAFQASIYPIPPGGERRIEQPGEHRHGHGLAGDQQCGLEHALDFRGVAGKLGGEARLDGVRDHRQVGIGFVVHGASSGWSANGASPRAWT